MKQAEKERKKEENHKLDSYSIIKIIQVFFNEKDLKRRSRIVAASFSIKANIYRDSVEN